MPKTVSANEAKNRLGSLFGYVNDQDDEVIVEIHGKAKAVIMSISASKRFRTYARKNAAPMLWNGCVSYTTVLPRATKTSVNRQRLRSLIASHTS